jgi:hypothetical protein
MKKNQYFSKRITLNSKYMNDFEKVEDLTWMISDNERKIVKKRKKYGKKNSRQHKYKKIK